MRRTPRPHSKRPPYNFLLVERPGAELAKSLGIGDGAISKTGKGMYYMHRKRNAWDVGRHMFFA